VSESRQLVIPGAEGGTLVPREVAFMRIAEQALARLTEIPNERTRAAYKTAWSRWGKFCAEFQRRPLPIDPRDLIVHLEWIRDQEKKSPNTVRLALSALSALDQASRIRAGEEKPLSVRAHPIVQRWLKAWNKDPANPRAPGKKAPALQPADLERILRIAAEPPSRGSNRSVGQHAALYTRDRAMILIGVCAALRVSELVALDVGDVFETPRGLRLVIRRSKTDQHGEGLDRGIAPQAHLVRCPVDAWRQWMRLRGTKPGPLFVGVGRGGMLWPDGLSVRAAQAMFTARAKAAGLKVSSHSMRATFATLAAERGKSLYKIADQGGWQSLSVLRGYVRQGQLFDDNPSAGLLDE
jgi:integrase